jgi:hypothetical protein
MGMEKKGRRRHTRAGEGKGRRGKKGWIHMEMFGREDGLAWSPPITKVLSSQCLLILKNFSKFAMIRCN